MFGLVVDCGTVIFNFVMNLLPPQQILNVLYLNRILQALFNHPVKKKLPPARKPATNTTVSL